RVRYRVAVVKRADETAIEPLVRIKGVDERLRGREQNKSEKKQEGRQEEDELAAAGHGVGDQIPNPRLQNPEKSQTTNFNWRGSPRVWRLGLGDWGFLTVPFRPGSFSPSSSIPRRAAVPVCPRESCRTFRRTRRLAPDDNPCPVEERWPVSRPETQAFASPAG